MASTHTPSSAGDPGTDPAATTPLAATPAAARSPRPIALALQGGGSHGAFTWGVLDTLLGESDLTIEALSGTSAGAVNAVALADGWARAQQQGGSPADWRAAARTSLAGMWAEIGQWGALGVLPARFAQALWGGAAATQWAHANLWAQALGGLLSTYQVNPLDLNPLRDLLRRRIDFEGLRRPGVPRVFVSATQVATGKAAIFSGRRLYVDAVTASACLPTLFRAIEIDGQTFWDGGYSVNPALSPLIAHCGDPDLVVVQINPLRRNALPTHAQDVLDRIHELNFNASLLAQMRAIDRINRLLAEGALTRGGCKPVRLHRIDGGAALLAYSAATTVEPDPGLIRELFHIGQESALRWLGRHFEALGQRSTVDVRRDYEDDTRIDWPQACVLAPDGQPLA